LEVRGLRLESCRRVSENAFGIVTQRFRIYNRRLKLNIANVDSVIINTTIIRNYVRDDNVWHSGRCEAERLPETLPVVARNKPWTFWIASGIISLLLLAGPNGKKMSVETFAIMLFRI
jgi:hypothetical protein